MDPIHVIATSEALANYLVIQPRYKHPKSKHRLNGMPGHFLASRGSSISAFVPVSLFSVRGGFIVPESSAYLPFARERKIKHNALYRVIQRRHLPTFDLSPQR